MKSLHHKSVLVVDDDPAMVRALDKVLTDEGALVRTATDAAEAVQIMNQRQKGIDLVITDLRMPFVSGVTLLNGIHEIFPALPVIVLTAYGSPEVKSKCFREGASALLEKPLDTPHLLAAVRSAFSAAQTPKG